MFSVVIVDTQLKFMPISHCDALAVYYYFKNSRELPPASKMDKKFCMDLG